jgi:hypothetical protein
MHRPVYKLLKSLLLLTLCHGCSRPNEPAIKSTKSSYIAINGNDTARLDLVVTASTFKGRCAINFHNRYVDSGEVKGIVRGDSLLGDFNYLHYGLEWKRIAFALLRKNDQLLMGEGDQGAYFNIPYFKPDGPNFDTVRFIFKKASL